MDSNDSKRAEMQWAFDSLSALAREYCDFIDSYDGFDIRGCAPFLSRLSHLLPRLHAAVAVFGDAEADEAFIDETDLERRFELFSRLRGGLGELDGYWMEFDVARDGQEKSGSLADDLTDIYWELKIGLNRLQQQVDDEVATLRSWGAGYRLNWGQHLVDAERHLYALRARSVV